MIHHHRTTHTAAVAARRLIALLACAAALAGCGTATPRSDMKDDLNSQKGESGVTLFGTIDMGVGVQRSR